MWKLAAIVLAGLGLRLAESRVEAAPPDDIKAWLSKQIEGASGNFGGRAFRIQYRVESQEKLDTGELARLREKLKNLPEHPERARLRHLEQLEKYGPEVRKQTVWFRDGEMRVNREAGNDPSSKYFDFVSLKNSGWKMTPDQMFVLGGPAEQPAGHQLEIPSKAVMNEVRDLLAPGLRYLGKLDGVELVEQQDGTWIATRSETTERGAWRYEVRLGWESPSGPGRLLEGKVIDQASGDVVQRVVARDFVSVNGFASPVASSVFMESKGIPARVLIWEGSESTSDAEFRRVTTIPAFDGEDSIRGKVTFAQVTDHTSEDPSYVIRDKGGEVRNLDLPQAQGPGTGTQRLVGWAILGVLVVAFIWLRVRASR